MTDVSHEAYLAISWKELQSKPVRPVCTAKQGLQTTFCLTCKVVISLGPTYCQEV
jgi:hypothetical protein